MPVLSFETPCQRHPQVIVLHFQLVQPAHLILIPLAFRAFIFTRDRTRARWDLSEWSILAFIALQGVSSYLFAANLKLSVLSAGLLMLGVVAYLATFVSVCDRARLVFAGRAVLLVGLASAAVGIAELAAFYLFHSHFGVVTGKQAGSSAPVVAGLAFENNIYGSFSASAAIAFLVLSRERNPLFSRRFSVFGLAVCFVAMVISLTRAAWVGFAVAAIALVILRRRRAPRRNRVLQIGLVSFALAAVALGVFGMILTGAGETLPKTVASTGSQLFNLNSGSGQARASEWRLALADWKKNPMLGLGTNSYGQRHLAPKKSPHSPAGKQAAYLGNLYIRALYDSGILGLLFLLIFILAVLWPMVPLRHSGGDLAAVARAFLFGYATLMVAFAGTDASFQPWPWILAGVARAASSQAVRQSLQRATGPFRRNEWTGQRVPAAIGAVAGGGMALRSQPGPQGGANGPS